QPERVLPAMVEFVDIAGLVAGASKGEGLGNQFLSHIRETDAIVNVVRCFDDPNVIHVAGKGAPRLGDVVRKCEAALDAARPVRTIDFSKEELVVLRPLCLITAKPAMFV